MQNNNTSIVKGDINEVAKRLNGTVMSVVQQNLHGFEKAFTISSAILELKNILTDEYMAPIMQLQGNKLGFRTDKDKNRDGSKGPGYPVDVVKNCLIEAVLMGLQPVGNQFNIIAGNTYPTKEGLGHLLNTFEGLTYDIIVEVKAMDHVKKSSLVEAAINWQLNGVKNEKKVPIPIKIDDYTTVDAIVGKGTRKARAWLMSTITGMEVTDGEVTDTTYVDVTDKRKLVQEESEQRKADEYEELKVLFEANKEGLSSAQKVNIQRIVDTKEASSYKKALEEIRKVING